MMTILNFTDCLVIFQSKRSDALEILNLKMAFLLYMSIKSLFCLFLFYPVRGVNLSESEAELDGEHNVTELPQVYSGRGNMRSQQSAVRLTEVREGRIY